MSHGNCLAIAGEIGNQRERERGRARERGRVRERDMMKRELSYNGHPYLFKYWFI